MSQFTTYNIIATCPKNAETVLAQELEHFGATNIQPVYMAVKATIDANDFYRLHYQLHSASGILWDIKTFSAKNPEMVFSQISRINWANYFDATQAYKIEFVGDVAHKIEFGNKIRQAIHASFMRTDKTAPKSDVKEANIHLMAFLREDRLTVAIKTSGDSLHKRGHKGASKEHYATLKENLASAMLKIAKYDGSQLFYDPMCGSGTLPIEATYMALGKSPLIHRKDEQFGFIHLKNFDKNALKNTQDQLRLQKTSKLEEPIFASDINPKYVELTKHTALKARVEKYIYCFERDFLTSGLHYGVADYVRDFPQTPRLLISNIPYHIRQSETDSDEISAESTKQFYKLIGKKLKNDYDGWTVWFLVAKDSPWKMIGLKPTERHELNNGSIDVLFLKFEIYAFKSELKKK